MGIPSYFSYIIKNHPSIIAKLLSDKNGLLVSIDHLFMDCNSIIYDAVHTIDFNNVDVETYEESVISFVIDKINYYISEIEPTQTVFIAFDGVVPLAKMEQQKTRRYKSYFMQYHDNYHGNANKSPKWNTINITPGTKFMEKLSERLTGEFSNKDKILLSTSNEAGEGEHKMFEYMRNHGNKNENVMVYGLDADLIMLSIFHYQLFQNIYICREAPQFMLQLMGLPEETDTNTLYTMNISMLSDSIVCDMECGDANLARIYDYVFICFLLGNDFLPHFPSLNIRTHGIQILLDTYRKTLGGKPNCYIVNGDKINWKYFLVFLQELAKNEHVLLVDEINERNMKWGENKYWNHSREYVNLEEELLNMPVMFREKERYISPQYPHWEDRYYETLFNDGSLKPELFIENEKIRRCICYSYLEGLEWVLKYYKCGDVDWSWYYQYNYAPLLFDVYKYAVEYKNCVNTIKDFKIRKKGVIKKEILLMYVSPIETWRELGIYDSVSKKMDKESLKKHFSEIDELQFEWAFCRYFWESKVVYKKIPIEMLEHLNNM